MSGLIDLDTVAGARSTHKFARLSASKARVVLDLIRDDDLEQALSLIHISEPTRRYAISYCGVGV